MTGRAATEVAEALGGVVGSLPAGELRAGQLEMAEAVMRVLSRRRWASSNTAARTVAAGPGAREDPGHLQVAAGTGTGKSFAYLVPAVLSGKRVVVATATKALQEQLATKDLPRVARGLGRPVRWAVLKGRSNYLCRQRLAEMEALGRQGRLGEDGQSDEEAFSGRHADEVRRLTRWARRTRSGDRAELDFEPEPRVWSALSVRADECPGAKRCPSGRSCFAEHARAEAASADVVVVNLHLLGAHLRSGGAVLPEMDALVVDEAHGLEDVMAESLGADISPGRVRAAASAARASLGGRRARGRSPRGGAVDDVLGAAGLFEQALATAPATRLPQGLGLGGTGGGGGLGERARLLSSRLARLEAELREASREAPAGSDGAGAKSSGAKSSGADSSQRVLRALLSVGRLREELDECIGAGKDDVVWVSGGERPALRSAPLDVSAVLAAELFGKIPVVLTSATLAPGLGRRLGASPEALVELDVGSPFDYPSHALLYCAVGLPDRRHPGVEAAIHDELRVLIEAAGGRTLALFTSRRAAEAAAEVLRPRLAWPVLLQGDQPKAALLSSFTSVPAASLFATMGFWQGVDVPGASLSLVVIDRLPFPRPDEPLNAARREAAEPRGFRSVDLPRAATLLAQGAGRLVRTSSDRGVVAVLDRRLATASYSGYLVKALPPMRRTRSRDEAVAFLSSIAAPAEPMAPAAHGADGTGRCWRRAGSRVKGHGEGDQ
ncbi:MAG: ATP-dependent DNA helicase [Acidimicrobiales bacterium]